MKDSVHCFQAMPRNRAKIRREKKKKGMPSVAVSEFRRSINPVSFHVYNRLLQPAIPFIPFVKLPLEIDLLNLEKLVVCCTNNSHPSSAKQHKDCGARPGRSGRHVASYVWSFDHPSCFSSQVLPPA